MKIRVMQESDIEQVMAIERSVFPMPWAEHYFREFIEIDQAFVGCENEIFGYICFHVYTEKLLIANLAVKKAFQRKGIGTEFVRFAIDKAKQNGLSELTLDVRQSNRTAIKFYQKLGFERVRIKPGYYEHPPEDSIVMNLNLADWSRV